MSISKVWKKITDCAGQTFHTKTGVPFSYHIRNEYIYLENTNRAIPKRQVEESLSIRSDFVSDYKKFQGAAYLFGILHDERILLFVHRLAGAFAILRVAG